MPTDAIQIRPAERAGAPGVALVLREVFAYRTWLRQLGLRFGTRRRS